jgi:hypothetical protein
VKIKNHIENSGRKKLLDEETKNLMIERILSNRWTTAADL